MQTNEASKSPSYSPREVAQILGLETSSVYALISRGKLASNKVGSRRSISLNQLRAYCNQRQETLNRALCPKINGSYLITEIARFGKPSLLSKNHLISRTVDE
jgi:excisionase family DNA binding protein